MAEELLFEGMIDLSSSGINQSSQSNSKPNPAVENTEFLAAAEANPRSESLIF